jgi:hypothetical protein
MKTISQILSKLRDKVTELHYHKERPLGNEFSNNDTHYGVADYLYVILVKKRFSHKNVVQ